MDHQLALISKNCMVKVFSSLEEAQKAIPLQAIKLLIIDGKKFSIANSEIGFQAFDNACPHQNEPLSKGLVTASGDIVCALHHYRFKSKSGQEVNNRCVPLKFYPILVTNDGVFIDI